ncbi:MAG: glycogen debranching protein GlgX, partial [Thermodesulfobacteriota bacterium]
KTDDIWHCYIPDLKPGQLYAYRVYGDYDPANGLRYNPYKLLLDPYARAITGDINLEDVHYDFDFDKVDSEFLVNNQDSAENMPKCVVLDGKYDWENDTHPNIPWSDTIIYETHVKGFSILNEDIPKSHRGTYSGLSSKASIDYLKNLGITAVELLPVHHSVAERTLVDQGLTNYWGYNTVGFFAPDSRYSSTGIMGEQVEEFKDMVKALHNENIEVILDVVYNHTAEGGKLGPNLNFRGIDNLSYYKLKKDSKSDYENFTGTGNSINSGDDIVIRMVLESLRYWVEEMHIDGFRFDLATVLGREEYDFHRHSKLLELICNDTVLSKVKLIAEPWDIGYGGYQVGNFPDPFSEWNDKYRNTLRQFWRGDSGQLADMAYCISGSSNLYNLRSKGSHTSINYVCSHDGFTLEDLVSYENKHNLANLECNKDGTNENFSYNFGYEGETTNKEILERRERQKRNFIATVFLSQGTPMLLSGDEAGRTQQGNNNSYCQDNIISWLDWKRLKSNKDLNNFTRELIKLRKNSPILTKGQFFDGKEISDTNIRDLIWYLANGREISEEDWQNSNIKSLCLIMAFTDNTKSSDKIRSIRDNSLMIFLNGSKETEKFIVPDNNIASKWEIIINTSSNTLDKKGLCLSIKDNYIMLDRSLVVLKPRTGRLTKLLTSIIK